MTVEGDDLVTAFGGIFTDSAASLERVRAVVRAAEAETERVAQVIARDIACRYQDNTRKLAELKIRDGLSVDLLDMVIEPTPEWLGQGEHVSFTAPVPERSAKVVTTRRRVVIGHCLRALRAGRIDADEFRACAWYKDQYQRGGFDGRIGSVDMSKEVHFRYDNGFYFTELQLHAQSNYRAARSSVPEKWLTFFEMVVISDKAVDEARRMAPSGRDPWEKLRLCARKVGGLMELADPDWKIGLTDVC